MHFPYPIIPSDYLFPFSKLHFSLSVIIFLETRIQFKIRFYSFFFFSFVPIIENREDSNLLSKRFRR